MDNPTKGYIQDQAIALIDPLPEVFRNGDEVEITITTVVKKKKTAYPFPVFNLAIHDDYLDRGKMYGPDASSV